MPGSRIRPTIVKSGGIGWRPAGWKQPAERGLPRRRLEPSEARLMHPTMSPPAFAGNALGVC